MPARHYPYWQRALRAVVAEEIALPQRNVLGLVVHILPATRNRGQSQNHPSPNH